VQLPYQITHNIPTWVDWTNPQGGASSPGLVPGAIQATPLTGPPGSTVTTTTTTVTPGAPVPLAPAVAVPAVPATPVPATGNLVPPGYPGAPTALTPPQ